MRPSEGGLPGGGDEKAHAGVAWAWMTGGACEGTSQEVSFW